MKLALTITSWIAIVIGGLAFIGFAGDPYTLIGAVLFLTQGILALVYINKQEKK